MNKNLAAAISAAAIVAAIGICGGIECGTIAFEAAILPPPPPACPCRCLLTHGFRRRS